MKKLCIYFFLVLLSLQTASHADDIRDFQIEGMSIGDSLLDHFTEEEINKVNIGYYENSKKFAYFSMTHDSFKVFEGVQFAFKPETKIIHNITGRILFLENFNDCLIKKDEIASELSQLFKNTKREDIGKRKHPADKSGKSYFISSNWTLESDDVVRVFCTNWSDEMKYPDGVKYPDGLKLAINTAEYINFLNYEAYK